MTDKGPALHHLVRQLISTPKRTPPLLLLLHAFTENESAMHRFAPRLGGRFCVVSVRAPIDLDAGRYAWARARFTPDGPEDDAGDLEASRRTLLRFIDELVPAYGLDPELLYLMGFSQGELWHSVWL